MKTILTPKYMFAYKYAAIAHACPTLEFKPHTGFLLEVVESTTDQLIIDDTDGDMISPIPDQTVEHVETIIQPSVGERILADEEYDVDSVDNSPTTGVESYHTGVPYMDDLFGENEGEYNEQEKNASEVPSSAKEAYILDACKLMFDKGNEQNVEVIQHTSSVLAAHLGGVYRTITTEVVPTVESLINDINTESDNIRNMSDSSELASYLDISNAAITKLNWADMSVLGNANTIINNVKQFSGFKGDNMLSFNAVKSVMTKWPTTVENTKISNTVKDGIINRIALELDGKTVVQHDELKMIDETDNGGIEPEAIIEKSEEIASEALQSFYTSVSNTSYASESIWSDIKKKIKEVFTSTDAHADNLSKISMSKYSTVKKEDLPNNVVTLLNKKFANELYTTLNRNYMVVEKLIRQFNTVTVGTTTAQSDAIIDMGNKLTRELPGYKNEGTALHSLFSNNSTKSSVKNSEWKIGDLAIVPKLIDLSKRYRYIGNSLHEADIIRVLSSKYGEDGSVNKDFNNETMYNCLLVIEYYVAYSGYLMSNVVKTCLRIVDAYDKALESVGSEGFDYNNSELITASEAWFDRITLPKLVAKIRDYLTDMTKNYETLSKIDLSKYSKIDISSNKVEVLNLDYALKLLKLVETVDVDIAMVEQDGDNLKANSDLAIDMSKKYKNIAEQIKSITGMTSSDFNKASIEKHLDKYTSFVTVKQSGYSIDKIKMLLTKMKKLNDVFDSIPNVLLSGRFSRGQWFILFIASLFVPIPGSSIISLGGAIFGRDKATADALNTMHDTAKIFYGVNNALFNAIIASIKNVIECYDKPAVESIIPYMDDLLGEHEGEDDEQEQNASEVSKAVATEVYHMVASSLGYERLTKYLHHIMQNRDAGVQTKTLMDMVTSYPKVLELYRTLDLGISSTDTQIIRNNVSTVMDVLSTVGVQLLTYRKHFKDNNVLILSKDLVNSDMLPTFEQQHGTMEDISRHILHRYTLLNADTPYEGVRIAEVLNNKQAIASEHFKLCDETKRQLDLKEGGVNLLAYNKVLTKYLEMTPSDKLPMGMSMSNFIRENLQLVNKTSALLKYSEYSMDDCVYRFLFDLWYRDRPVYQQMYNKFTNKYRQVYESSYDDITTQQRMQADAEVLSDIALEFIMDKFVV